MAAVKRVPSEQTLNGRMANQTQDLFGYDLLENVRFGNVTHASRISFRARSGRGF
jgi:hypothetical protein